MKKYFWVAIALTTMGVYAENNPFALQKNLQKIDQDQDVLLSALKEMTEKKEAAEALEDDNEADTVDEEEEAVLPTPEVHVSDQSDENTSADTQPTEAQPKAQPVSTTEENTAPMQAAEEARIAKVKAEQAKIEKERAEQAEKARLEQARLHQQEEAQRQEALRKQEEERIAAQKREQERLEVEEYEAKRLAKKKAEAQMAKQSMEAEEMNKKETSEAKHTVVDINLTREDMIAKKSADEEYMEAIKEVDNEE